MTNSIDKNVMLELFLLSRFFVKVGKKMDKEKIISFVIACMLSEKNYTIRELANLFTVSHPFMSALIAKLEKNKILTKKIGRDHRTRRLYLTEKGAKLCEDNKGSCLTMCNVVFRNMDSREIRRLGELLNKLNRDYRTLINNVSFKALL